MVAENQAGLKCKIPLRSKDSGSVFAEMGENIRGNAASAGS
jgi:hypothetical protein